jgi:hypothetical protein
MYGVIDIYIFLFYCLGGFQGEVKFQLTYSSGGAIDASTALREVNSICESFMLGVSIGFIFFPCFL